MNTNDNNFKFPQNLPHGKNGSSLQNSDWILEEVMLCQDANVSVKKKTKLEIETMNKMMRSVSGCKPYKLIEKNHGSLKHDNTYKGCQSISKFQCTYNNCQRKYAIFRSHEKLAAYTHGGHDHTSDYDRNRGISDDVKQMIIKSQSVTDTFSILEDIKIDKTQSKEIRRLLGQGRQLDESYKNKMHAAWQTLKKDEKWFPKSRTHSIPLGIDMETLTNSVNSQKMTIQDFASTSKAELVNMTQEEKTKLIVLSTDIGDNDDHSYTHLAFTTYAALETFDATIDSAKSRNAAIQFEADYAHDIMEFKEVGSLGISDLSKRYHSLIWDINVTENSEGSGRLVKFSKQICKIRGYDGDIDCNLSRHKLLSDGAPALKNAAEMNKFFHLLCLSHMIRSGVSYSGKGGHGR